MSFYTALMFYRPTPPPMVSGRGLAEFVRAFARLGLSQNEGPMTASLKFGEAIDQDEKPASWFEPLIPGIGETQEIEWDVEESCGSLANMAQLLSDHDRPIYRGYLGLGKATDDVSDHLKRVGSPENETDLVPDAWSLEIGLIESVALNLQEALVVGWISVAISGNGYLYPWSFRELVERAERHPSIRRLMQLCRETWPVLPEAPTAQEIEKREQMGDLWPYGRHDLPWDWYWGLHETG